MEVTYYYRIIYLKMKEVFQYRFAFLNNVFAQFFAYMVTFINITILLQNIHVLNGWMLNEILLLWALNVFSYGMAGMFFYNGCNGLEWQIQGGEMDIFYVQPRSIFWNYMFKNISPIFIFHISFSIVFLVYTLCSLNVRFFFGKLLYFLLLLFCSICIQACIMILFASSSFKVIKSGNILSTAIYGLRNFTTYPFSIYGKGIRLLLTFILPYAFVSYYPALYALGKIDSLFDMWMIRMEPFITSMLILMTFMTWRKGTYAYCGTGT